MTRSIRLTAATALFAWLFMPSGADAQSSADQSAVEARAKEFAHAISTGRPAEMERLVREHFDRGMQRIPMPAHIGVQMSYWDLTRGMDVVRLERSTPEQAFVVLRNHLTQRESLIFMRVEAEAPHRITTVQPIGLLIDGQPIPMPHPAPPARLRSDAQIVRELGAYMSRLVRADVFSGVVLVAKDGRVVFHRAYGQADKEAGVSNQPETRFNLASMHKMITGVAVAQLVSAGKLSYEDAISKFFPDAAEGSPYTKIRIKHLVSHTSGLPFWYSPDNPPDYSGRPETNDDILREVSEEKLQFEPGARYQYSNLAFHLLGAVIAQVSGMSYEDYVRENIYKPAGMENGNAPRDSGSGAYAYSYAKQFDEHGKVSFHRSEYANPEAGPGHADGGGWASAGDLLKFYQALRSGKLLSDAALQEVLSPKPELNSQRYGYGFDIDPVRGSAGHSGGGLGVSDYSEMFTRSGWISIVMSNYTENSFEVCEPAVLKIRELLDVRMN